jgi:hypothetical protein
VDVVTDIMSEYLASVNFPLLTFTVMLLPTGLIWHLQMPLNQKLSIGALFFLAWICIAVSVIRVKELGSTVTERSAPSTSWLALWGTVEAAIAVIIGCCPGLYRIVKQQYSTYKSNSNQRYANNYGAPAAINSHGYAQYAGKSDDPSSGDIGLRYLQNKSRVRTTVRGGNSYYDDTTSSQEELARESKKTGHTIEEGTEQGNTGITVTRSVTVMGADHNTETDSPIGVAKWRDSR